MTSHSIAQTHYQDVVYLKNGSIIRGMIIEQVPNQSIKIETADRSVFFFKLEEIEKFTREPASGRQSPLARGEGGVWSPGFIRITELGYEGGTGRYGINRFKFNFINSYQFTPHFSAGLGTGFRYYIDADIFALPILTDLRATILKGPISPYFALGLGYTLDTKNRFEGMGFLVSPNIGANFRISERNTVNVGIGYEVQRLSSRYNYYWGSINSPAISLTAGISF